MKTITLKLSLLALITPLSVYGMGLGQMTVKSALDQPFLAEIELIDIGKKPFNTVQVNLADPDHFKEIGLERAAAVSLLSFQIDKNQAGKPVIMIRSQERMTEPYMEVVVDLTWPDGQIYKAYTVLLDPPGYKLVSTKIQGGPLHYAKGSLFRAPQRSYSASPPQETPTTFKQSTYGPTIANENVWQIAQHYKTSELILPQIVLSIVGANPDAFKDGNLNGLKEGQRLTIPSTDAMEKVTSDLATAEAMAHDKAWNDKSPIHHLLTPPYTNANAENLKRTTLNIGSSLPSLDVAEVGSKPEVKDSIPTINPPAVLDTSRIELSMAKAAMEAIKESNAILKEQLHMLQEQNRTLLQKMSEREEELKIIRQQLASSKSETQTLAGQLQANQHNYLPLWLLLLAGGAGVGYWYYRNKSDNPKTKFSSQFIEPHLVKPDQSQVEQAIVEKNSPQDEKSATFAHLVKTEPVKPVAEPVKPVVESVKPALERLKSITKPTEPFTESESNALEFERVLVEPPQSQTKSKQTKSEQDNDNSIDFLGSEISANDEPAALESVAPLKSQKALDTLIALSKTYAEMGDVIAAKDALSEVMEFGDDKQKQQATQIIENLNNKP